MRFVVVLMKSASCWSWVIAKTCVDTTMAGVEFRLYRFLWAAMTFTANVRHLSRPRDIAIGCRRLSFIQTGSDIKLTAK